MVVITPLLFNLTFSLYISSIEDKSDLSIYDSYLVYDLLSSSGPRTGVEGQIVLIAAC